MDPHGLAYLDMNISRQNLERIRAVADNLNAALAVYVEEHTGVSARDSGIPINTIARRFADDLLLDASNAAFEDEQFTRISRDLINLQDPILKVAAKRDMESAFNSALQTQLEKAEVFSDLPISEIPKVKSAVDAEIDQFKRVRLKNTSLFALKALAAMSLTTFGVYNIYKSF